MGRDLNVEVMGWGPTKGSFCSPLPTLRWASSSPVTGGRGEATGRHDSSVRQGPHPEIHSLHGEETLRVPETDPASNPSSNPHPNSRRNALDTQGCTLPSGPPYTPGVPPLNPSFLRDTLEYPDIPYPQSHFSLPSSTTDPYPTPGLLKEHPEFPGSHSTS